jgi:hypothetical protein
MSSIPSVPEARRLADDTVALGGAYRPVDETGERHTPELAAHARYLNGDPYRSQPTLGDCPHGLRSIRGCEASRAKISPGLISLSTGTRRLGHD